MADTDQKRDDSYSDAETERRAEATLRRMLATPHKPHRPIHGDKMTGKRNIAPHGD